MPRSAPPDSPTPAPRKSAARKRVVRRKTDEESAAPIMVDFTASKKSEGPRAASPLSPPHIAPPSPPPTLVPAPFEKTTRVVFWSGLALVIGGSIALAAMRLRDHEKTIYDTTLELAKLSNARLDSLSRLALEAEKLSAPSSPSIISTSFETETMRQLEALPMSDDTTQAKAGVHMSLAKLAWSRGDSLKALEQARQGRQLMLAGKPAPQPEALVEAELLIATILAEETNFTAISSEIAAHVAGLPEGPQKVDAAFRHLVLQAQSASRNAADSLRVDQVKRDLGRAQLKVRAVALSDQLRSEMNGENQRREKLQQEAATENDPGKMARAMKEKDTYDERFRAELQRREDDLRQQTQTALQPDANLTAALQNATDLWRQALQFGEANSANGVEAPETGARAIDARLGLATALLAQDNLAGAEDAVKGLGEDTAGLAADAARLARTKLVQARVALRKSAVVAKDQAAAALAANITSLEKSLAALARNGKSDFRQKELAGQIQSTLANLHNAAGHKEAAAAAMTEAAALLADSAADGSWMEILHAAQARVNQCRDLLRQSSASPVAAALSQSVELHQSLAAWRAELLKESPDAEVVTASRAAVEKIVKEKPDAFPWAALIPLE